MMRRSLRPSLLLFVFLLGACSVSPTSGTPTDQPGPEGRAAVEAVKTPSRTTLPAVPTESPDLATAEGIEISPVAVVPTSVDEEEVWHALRQRPLALPKLDPGSPCPRAESIELPGTDAERGFGGSAIGDSPVYALAEVGDGLLEYDPSRAPDGSEWGQYKVLWGIDPRYDGPALVRGRQIDGPNELRFDQETDPSREMRIEVADDAAPGGWRDRPSYTRLRTPGCYAYQVDGLDFSQIIVFEVTGAADRAMVEPGATPKPTVGLQFFEVVGLADDGRRIVEIDALKGFVTEGTRIDAEGRRDLLAHFARRHAQHEHLRLRRVVIGRVDDPKWPS